MAVIYALCEPGSELIRYVGQTRGDMRRRMSAHTSRANRDAKLPVHRWMASLDGAPVVRLLEQDCPDPDAAEKRWIASLRASGVDLLNLTIGGKSAAPHTAEAKAKIGAAHRGRQKDRDWVERYSAPQRGVPRGPMDDATKEKVRAGNLGKKRSQETKDRLREAALRRWQRPDYRERQIAARHARTQTAVEAS